MSGKYAESEKVRKNKEIKVEIGGKEREEIDRVKDRKISIGIKR